MLKIAVFCGGTGSAALQKGFASLYGIDHLQMDVIVNAYDNGKSTGVCRRVYGNRILGPSDVRKNQLLQYSLRYSDALLNETSREARLYRLFNVRLSAPDPEAYHKAAREYLSQFDDILDAQTWAYLHALLDDFFFETDENGGRILRRTVIGESFADFALSNIFYAACAAQCGNSLGAAMERMSKILGLKDTVHLISDKSLLLMAQTQSGRIIRDEGEIVRWDHPDDRIVRAILMNGEEEYIPTVGEGCSHTGRPVSQIIEEADIIIFSSGTQWSSLIPTYMHRGLREMIRKSSAKKYLVMNNVEDHDTLGVSAAELCELLERYLDMGSITVVLNEFATESMSSVPPKYHSIRGRKIGLHGSKTHIPEELAKTIMGDYYAEALACKKQLFDLDGTLWNEKGTAEEKRIGAENLRLFDGVIVTGNSVEHARSVLSSHAPDGKIMDVFADYGNTYFRTDAPDSLTPLTSQFFLPEGLMQKLSAMKEFEGKSVKMRGRVVITIKPLENRERIAEKLNEFLAQEDNGLIAYAAGRTSIDISYSAYTKARMLELIFSRCGIAPDEAVFIGNELKTGSEKGIAALKIATLQTNDVYECYVYLKTRERIVQRQTHVPYA